MLIGSGYDVHPLVEGRRLVLGGVEIDWHLGLDGHSDADVLIHAICDACLGALALGDIGMHFPASNEKYRDIDSRELLRLVSRMIKRKKWEVSNLDCTIIAEKPKLSPYIEAMRNNISSDLGPSPVQVNIKATTTEGLGFAGREEGIAAQAVVLLRPIDR
jgi:2-C-methyl-D-erythritol 2,4-cyclodiphosphate synthase